MGQVIRICQTDITFTLDEAHELLPIVRRIVIAAESEVEKLMADQRYFLKIKAESQIKRIDDLVGKTLVRMGSLLVKLGLKVYGNGFVSFPDRTHLWSWHFTEDKITHWHPQGTNPMRVRYKINPMVVVT